MVLDMYLIEQYRYCWYCMFISSYLNNNTLGWMRDIWTLSPPRVLRVIIIKRLCSWTCVKCFGLLLCVFILKHLLVQVQWKYKKMYCYFYFNGLMTWLTCIFCYLFALRPFTLFWQWYLYLNHILIVLSGCLNIYGA